MARLATAREGRRAQKVGIITLMSSHSIARPRSPHDVGEAVDRDTTPPSVRDCQVGQGLFRIGENGNVKVHPTKDPQPVDRPEAAGRRSAAARHQRCRR